MDKDEKEKTFVKVEKKKEGSGDIISKIIKTEKSTDDETLIDIKVTNPLHRIAQILQDIKNHQATTVSLRFTIPLIALPIVILLAFQVGRSQTTCTQNFSSKIGVVKNLYVQAPKDKGGSLFYFLPFNPIKKTEDPKNLISQKKTVLLSNNEVLSVLPNPRIDLSSYEDQTVIITGNYSSCSNSITLDSPQNISFLSQ